jgi:hypothetical protein
LLEVSIEIRSRFRNIPLEWLCTVYKKHTG